MESTRKRSWLFTVCFALAFTVFFVSIGPRSAPAITQEQLLDQVAEKREKYLDSFADRACFLSDLEKKTTEDNRLTELYQTFEPDNPRIFLLPFEKRLFFDRACMLTNDGHYLDKFKDKDAFLKEYGGVLANCARIVPLYSFMETSKNENGELVLEDYFPIAGVFLRVPFTLKAVEPDALPWIHIETEILAKVKGEVRKVVASKRTAAKEISVPGADSRYFDLSIGVGLLEPYPGRQIKLGVPDAFLKTFKDADLVTVHQYCLRNARFDKNTVNEVEQAAPSNLKIHLDITRKN